MLFIEFPAFTKAVTKCPMMTTPSFNMSLFPIPNKEPSFGVQAGFAKPEWPSRAPASVRVGGRASFTYLAEQQIIILVTIYAKAKKADLRKAEENDLRKVSAEIRRSLGTGKSSAVQRQGPGRRRPGRAASAKRKENPADVSCRSPCTTETQGDCRNPFFTERKPSCPRLLSWGKQSRGSRVGVWPEETFRRRCLLPEKSADFSGGLNGWLKHVEDRSLFAPLFRLAQSNVYNGWQRS